MTHLKSTPEDGARLYGGVKEVAPGFFRAWCYAKNDRNYEVVEEEREQKVCGSRDDALAWLEASAVWRGFNRYTPDNC